MEVKTALSVRSDFSIGESIFQVDKIVETAKSLGYESVALVDTMSVHAMVDFSTRAKKAGIKPIVGCRLRVYEDPFYKTPKKMEIEKGALVKDNRSYSIKVYVKSEKGMKGLIGLLSRAASKEQFYYHARTGLDDVLALEDVVVTTGDFHNLFTYPEHDDVVSKLLSRFKNDFYVELVPVDTPLFDTTNAKALKSAAYFACDTVATYPALYKEAADAPTLEVMSCIANQHKMEDRWRLIQYVQDFHMHPTADLWPRVKGAAARVAKWGAMSDNAAWAKAVLNANQIAAKCSYVFGKLPVSLPKMAEDEVATLKRKCIEGWKKRFSAPVLGHQPTAAETPAYRDRLVFELGVLEKMGFCGYFLLVEDMVNWAKDNDIRVGPGRGSVGGSLVAYLLGITDVDPIRFNLLFERFINPERLDLPDADLDFMSSRRHEVVEYLSTKYGADRVAGISNYSTMASASAVRDSGRVFGLSGLDLTATKLVPKEHGQSVALSDAAKMVPEIEKFTHDYPKVWAHALRLEGAMRNFGQHAAGVVVAGEPLVNRAVVETRTEGIPVTNWDKRVVEDWGLVKMDLLGLSTLDVLEIARQYIRERHGKDVDYLKLPWEEPAIMDAFGRGDTTGVFQFESAGMRKLLKDLAKGGRLTFEDISAATALYRPGPMDSGLMDDYVAIRQGVREPFYEHDAMKPALEPTLGVIVYQEQVMQLSRDLAGFTGAEADHLRKAMGKKDKDKMAEMRSKWVEGCEKHIGMDSYTAGELFDKIEAFAGYGFNKSHSYEYSLISYWTMWVRVNYPAEYFAACMSIVKEDKLPGLVKDARECGIEVLPPDVNKSGVRYVIPEDNFILAPFTAVAQVSDNTAARIVELRAREGGKFADEDHFRTVCGEKGSKVNKTVVENLNLVGALASIQPGSKPARSLDRRKDQIKLLPGLVIDSVKAERSTDAKEPFLRAKIVDLVREYSGCKGCDLSGNPHPIVRFGGDIKFMVVFDNPTWEEEKAGKTLEGATAEFVKAAIKEVGLNVRDGYFTSLVKAKKTDKFLSNAQINGCKQHLVREVELIKPPIIVALGNQAIKHFVPGLKGGAAELAGKTYYDEKLDATIVCGINPGQVIYDPTKLEILEAVFEKVQDMIA
ncbi:DNA polymerase III subunit alpha [Cupriavidus campinensis]|uniref:DNA polymerase III subunit alpha n=1 Tax=Cupriavidus campinensis TaxID=151783 RepID=A0ABY3ESP4_9BURK|nr:DNA polymerase III subunit alpha [Cupriavidus campinensis]